MLHFFNSVHREMLLTIRMRTWMTAIWAVSKDIVLSCYPFKPFAYWGHQFTVTTKRTYQHDPRYLVQSYVEIGLLAVWIARVAYHALLPQTDRFVQVYSWDILAVNDVPFTGKMEFVLAISGVIVFYHIHYHKLYKETVLYENIKWLVQGQVQKLSILFRNRDLVARTLASIQATWKVYELFILLADATLIAEYFHLMFVYFGMAPANLPWSTMIIQLAEMLVFFLIQANFIIMLSKFGTLYGPFGTMQNKVIHHRIHRCHTLLATTTGNPIQAIRKVRIAQVETLLFLVSCNRIYGLMLVVFLLGHVPLSGTMAMYVLFNDGKNREFRFAMCALIAGQYTVLVYHHYVSASLTKALHSVYLPFMSAMIKQGRKLKLYSFRSARFHMRSAWHVQAFHVKQRYGITYASFGLVSLSAFGKFALFYGEYVMKNYTAIRERSQ